MHQSINIQTQRLFNEIIFHGKQQIEAGKPIICHKI
ncbi:hypothetical protein SHLI107390_00630 [Shewanella livingstonensis]